MYDKPITVTVQLEYINLFASSSTYLKCLVMNLTQLGVLEIGLCGFAN